MTTVHTTQGGLSRKPTQVLHGHESRVSLFIMFCLFGVVGDNKRKIEGENATHVLLVARISPPPPSSVFFRDRINTSQRIKQNKMLGKCLGFFDFFSDSLSHFASGVFISRSSVFLIHFGADECFYLFICCLDRHRKAANTRLLHVRVG